MKTAQELKLVNPSTGEIFRKLPYHSWEAVKTKLTIVGKIQKEWKKSSIVSRIKIVQNAIDYFKSNEDTIAQDITLQMGKPISQSINEVKGTIHRAEVCCGLAEDALKDISLPELEGFQRFIRRESLGVVMDIAAWNYPLLIAVNVVVPAILAGNVV